MFQRFVVVSLLLLGLGCVVYGFAPGLIFARPSEEMGGWALGVLGGLVVSASLIYLSGVSATSSGLAFKDNFAGYMLWDKKSPEQVHCTVYISAFVMSLVLLIVGTIAVGVVYVLKVSVVGIAQNGVHINWGFTSPTVEDGYGVLLILGFFAAIGAVGFVIFRLAQYIAKKVGVSTDAVAIPLTLLALFVVMVAYTSTNRGYTLQMALVEVSFGFLWFGKGLFFLALMLFPFWIGSILKKFVPSVYRKVCPVVTVTQGLAKGSH